MSIVSREYKDRLFNFLFGAEENKAWTLSLYNAVNHSDYTDATCGIRIILKRRLKGPLRPCRRLLSYVRF